MKELLGTIKDYVWKKKEHTQAGTVMEDFLPVMLGLNLPGVGLGDLAQFLGWLAVAPYWGPANLALSPLGSPWSLATQGVLLFLCSFVFAIYAIPCYIQGFVGSYQECVELLNQASGGPGLDSFLLTNKWAVIVSVDHFYGLYQAYASSSSYPVVSFLKFKQKLYEFSVLLDVRLFFN